MLRFSKRIGIAIGGGSLAIAGLVLAVPLVPGPGLAVLLLGLAILSLEFERPRRWLARIKAGGVAARHRLRDRLARRCGRS